jgi:hypothetical protein
MDEGDRLRRGLDVVGTAVSSVAGFDAVGIGRAIFDDKHAPDPVVPPDLHLVKPATVDADGNVTCLWCRQPVPVASADLVGSDGYVCRPCNVKMGASDVPVELSRRRVWPWLAGGGIAVAGISIGVYVLHARNEAEQLAKEYPIAATSRAELLLERHAPAWDRDRIVGALGTWTPAPIASLTQGGSCPLGLAVPRGSATDEANTDEDREPASFRALLEKHDDPDLAVTRWLVAGPGLADRAATQVDTLLAAADRKRFRSIDAQERIVDTIASPLLVVQLDLDLEPQLADADRDRFQGGARRGTAYAFDPRTGTLTCAGAFTATSSEKVQSLDGMMPLQNNAHAAIARDFEASTLRAIAAGLRQVK